MTRSLTISSTMSNTIEQIQMKPSRTSTHLPDIIPSSTTPTKSMSVVETITPSITTENNHVRLYV